MAEAQKLALLEYETAREYEHEAAKESERRAE